jgi:membrane protein implicated in regulation of membrane protease activity
VFWFLWFSLALRCFKTLLLISGSCAFAGNFSKIVSVVAQVQLMRFFAPRGEE